MTRKEATRKEATRKEVTKKEATKKEAIAIASARTCTRTRRMIGTRRNLTLARTRRHVRLTLLTTRRPRRLSIRSDARRRKSGRHRHRFDHLRKLNPPARPIRTMRARPRECSKRNRRKRRRHRMPITTRSGCVASASHSAQRLQRLLLHNHPPSIRKRPTKQQWRRSEGASSTRNQRAMSRGRALQPQ